MANGVKLRLYLSLLIAVSGGLNSLYASNPDSLLQLLKVAANADEKLSLSLQLTQHYYEKNDLKEEWKHAQSAHALSKLVKPGPNTFFTLHYYARSLRQRGAYDAAFRYFFAALDTFPSFEQQLKPEHKCLLLMDVAWSYNLLEKFRLSEDYYQRAGRVALSYKDSLQYAVVLMNLAQVKEGQGRVPESLIDMMSAMDIYQRNGKEEAASHITQYYFSAGIDTSEQLLCFYDIEDLREVVRKQAGGRGYLSHFYYMAMVHLAGCEWQAGNKAQCYALYDSIANVWPKIEDPHYRTMLLTHLTRITEAMGNGEKAGNYREMLRDLKDQVMVQKDAVFDAEIERRLRMESDLERKNYVLSNRLLLIISATILLGLLAIVVLNRVVKQRKKLEQKLLRSQLDPHFIRNALGMIQRDILESRPDLAVKTTALMGRVFDRMMSFAAQDYIRLEEEQAFLEDYIKLQQKRFDDNFEYAFVVAPELNTKSLRIPPMLIQPLLENAFVHGGLGREPGGKLVVALSPAAGKGVKILVSNNGKPFDGEWPPLPLESDQRRHSLRLIHERLIALSGQGLDLIRPSAGAGERQVSFAFSLS